MGQQCALRVKGLHSLVKNLGKMILSIWVKNLVISVWILLGRNDLIHLNILAVLKSLKNNYQTRKSFIVPWTVKNSDTEYEHVFKTWLNLKLEQWKIIATSAMFHC